MDRLGSPCTLSLGGGWDWCCVGEDEWRPDRVVSGGGEAGEDERCAGSLSVGGSAGLLGGGDGEWRRVGERERCKGLLSGAGGGREWRRGLGVCGGWGGKLWRGSDGEREERAGLLLGGSGVGERRRGGGVCEGWGGKLHRGSDGERKERAGLLLGGGGDGERRRGVEV